MNEELKIIIKAVTDEAKKSLGEVNKQIEGISKTSGSTGSKVAAVFKGVGKIAGVAAVGIGAIIGAITALGKGTVETQKEIAKLNAAFQAAGSTAQQAGKTYNEMYRFLGDSGKATEASAHLAKITTNQKQLAEWTKISQGVYATFGDSLPIESLTEAANETIKVGKVTGAMADALNWAGVSEDAFNATLAQATSTAEREAITRETLNKLYENAAEIYEHNNKAMLDYNESQANMQRVTAEVGKAVLPLMTALNNLGSALLTALKPAFDVIIPVIVDFINLITSGVNSIMSFFGALTGKAQSVKTVAQVANSISSASSGAGALASGFEDANKQAEELKRTTQGFDELNVLSSGTSASGGGVTSGGGSGSAPGAVVPGSTLGFATEITEGETKASGFAKTVKNVFGELIEWFKTTFAPSIEAWGGAFDTVAEAFKSSIPSYANGLGEIWEGFKSFYGYVLNEFVPDIVNSFSVNLAPVIADVLGFSIIEGGKTFEWLGGKINEVTNDIIIPALDSIKEVYTGTFDAIGTAWNEYGEPFLETLGGFFETIRGHIDNLYTNVILPLWNGLKTIFDELWKKHLQPFVERVVSSALSIGTNIMILYNKYIAPVVDFVIKYILPVVVKVALSIVKTITGVLGAITDIIGGIIRVVQGIIEFITGVFTGDWDKAWEGVKNIIGGWWEIIEGNLLLAWETIKGIFAPVVAYFTGIWDGVKEIFAPVVDWFKEKFEAAYGEIKKAFANPKEYFAEKWDEVKKWFREKVQPKFTITYWKEKFNKIKEGAKQAFNGVLGIVEEAVNKIIRKINTLSWDIPDWVPVVGGGKFGFNFKEISIPRLAQGGIVTSSTIANIGERGKEAVLPLENNTQWMDKLAEKLAERTGTPSRIVLTIDGRELGNATIAEINKITRQKGTLPLVVM